MLPLITRYQELLKEINSLSKKSGFATQVRLLAISKNVTTSTITTLYQQGQVDFGESYVGELCNKAAQLKHLPISWHFIGNLQSNKIKMLVNEIDWVESIENLKQISLLSQYRNDNLAPLNCLIQINSSGATTQHGVAIDNLAHIYQLAQAIEAAPNLRLRGLMAIAAKSEQIDIITNNFKSLRRLFEQLQQQFNTVDCLSMGMSSDFTWAILHGATQVRIGSKLFAERKDF